MKNGAVEHDVVGYPQQPEAEFRAPQDASEWLGLATAALTGGADEYEAVRRADHVSLVLRSRVEAMRLRTQQRAEARP